MSSILVALCYGSAMAASLYLLWHFGVKSLYWHLLVAALALGIGSIPLGEFWGRADMTLVVGWAFTFLFIWGLGGLIVNGLQHSTWGLKHR
jgi:hypothetical protein